MSNPKLQNLLYMVLVAGNFLNSVSCKAWSDYQKYLLWILKYFIKWWFLFPCIDNCLERWLKSINPAANTSHKWIFLFRHDLRRNLTLSYTLYNISTRQCRQRISLYLIRLWPSSFFVKYPDSTHFSLQKRMKCVCLGVITICGLKPSSTILIRICLKTGNIVLYLLLLIVKHNSHPALFRAATLATLRAWRFPACTNSPTSGK